jgi:hypothetical protein
MQKLSEGAGLGGGVPREATTPEQLPHRTANALAVELGVSPALFPGDHGGFGSHPDAFAARLQQILSGVGEVPRPA